MTAPAKIAGRGATIYVGGPSTALSTTNGAMTLAGDFLSATITAAAYRVLDPTATILLEESTNSGSSWHTYAATAYTLNRLLGKVTFPSARASTYLYRVSGFYIPLAALIYAETAEFKPAKDVKDTTPLGTADKEVGSVLRSSSGTITDFYDPSQFGTSAFYSGSTAIARYFETLLTNMSTFVLKLTESANHSILVWAIIDTDSLAMVIDDYHKQTVAFNGRNDADGNQWAHQWS
jgi:hypothetical protein